jgi:hypothetical protein
MELVNQRRNNSIRFPKRKYILINIVTIIFYFFFIYYNDSNDLNIDVNNSAINEISPLIFIRKKNDKVNDDIKLSNLLTYNNEIYQITREKFLYEKQKQLIFLSLANHIFKGTWTNSSSNEILGESTINFEKALERKTLSEVLYLKIINKQGKYIDSWTRLISLSKYKLLNRKINHENNTFEINGLFLSTIEKGELFQTKFEQKKCINIINMTFPLKYININITTLYGSNIYIGKMPIPGNNNFSMKLESNCSLNFEIKAKNIKEQEERDAEFGKLYLYIFTSLFSTFLYGIGMIIVFFGIRNYEGYISCINIEIFSLNSVWNFYCCVSNIHLAFQTDFNFFVIFCSLGLCSLMKFFAFDMIIYAIYWKIKEARIHNFCQLVKLKLRFYLLLCINLLVCFIFMISLFINNSGIIFISLILWFPQIIYNMLSNNKYGFPFIFILANSIDRLLYPLYFRAYDNNIFGLRTNYNIFILAVIIVILSIGILLKQTFSGPRFMLPYKWQENKNEFYKDFDEIKNICKDINEECVICLMPICPDNATQMVEMKDNNNMDENSTENNSENNINDDNMKEISENNILNSNEENNISDDNKLLIKEENEVIIKIEDINQKINNKNKCENFFGKLKLKLKEFFKYNFFYFYKASNNINNKPYILTPCKHIFHSECMEKWLEHKMECPNCRNSLDNYF